LTLQCFSQDSTKTLLIGVAGHISINDLGHLNTNPSVVANYKKHTLFLGPLFSAGVHPTENIILPGLQLGYQIYPNGKGKVFSFFFEYNFNFLSAKIKSGQTDFYWGYNKYTGERLIKILNNSHYLSYGFNVHFLKYFYFSTSLGLGKSWYKEESIWKANTGEKFSSGGKRNFNYINGLFKVGIGCNFLNIKKRT
jgi:hypothetical protein